MSRYNEDKKLYVIYRKDTHEYMQKPDGWGYFCNAEFFENQQYPTDIINVHYRELSEGNQIEVLEGSVTKWAFKQPLPAIVNEK